MKTNKEETDKIVSEGNMREWTINDARDGDILAVTMYPEGTWIGIFKEQNGCTFSSHCFVNTEGTFKLGTHNHGNGKAIHPATKEQRDLLFSKMKEAGYEWDAEKKEPKKIEDEPENYKKQVISEMANLVKDYIQHNPAWSEEDERKLEESIALIRSNNTGTFYYEKDELSSFLKSLRDRIQPQPKQEWREEDERILQGIIDDVTPYGECPDYPTDKERAYYYEGEEKVNWLKSLKERFTWKPSDKQMEALAWALSLAKNCGEECAFDIRTLYEQLNKLREE